MMDELTKPIPDLTDKELHAHLAQAFILFDECPTDQAGANTRQAIRDVADALQSERKRRCQP